MNKSVFTYNDNITSKPSNSQICVESKLSITPVTSKDFIYAVTKTPCTTPVFLDLNSCPRTFICTDTDTDTDTDIGHGNGTGSGFGFGSEHIIYMNAIESNNNNFFESRTQFDITFDMIFNQMKIKKRSACPIFVIITSNEFFKNYEISDQKHDENLEKSINYTARLSISGHKTFEQMIKMTDLDSTQIMATTTELLKMEIMSLDNIIPEIDKHKNFCLIFLKNSKFFIVLGDSKSKTYNIRDCHEPFQYTFVDKINLIDYLNKIYSFNTNIIVNDIHISEYSSIEYYLITKPFKIYLNEQ